MKKTVAIIGGGPAGLMAAETLSTYPLQINLYDSMPSLGRKLLMAGKSGLNLTHAEPFETFITRYGSRQPQIQPWLNDFTPTHLREWAKSLGIETFTGTSGRVFPTEMKASPLLRAWIQRLNASGITFSLNHKLTGLHTDGSLHFHTPQGNITTQADAILLALGGGSWSRLGSDGTWVQWLPNLGAKVEPLQPSNCGFDIAWSEFFKQKFEGHPIKSVVLSFKDFHQQGEFIITPEGVEGSLIYAASALLRNEIAQHGLATPYLDLTPDKTENQLTERLSKPRGTRSMASHLEKTINIKGVKAGLLREFAPKEIFTDPAQLAGYIKHLPIPIIAPRPLEEAISTAGGVSFESLNEKLMLKSAPGIFCAGEMLDWEAPTGGYLITACMASGRWAAHGIAQWLNQQN